MGKRKDEFADPGIDITKTQPSSVVTRHSLDEVAVDRHGEEWTRKLATFTPPMLAELSTPEKIQRDGGEWIYERKLDGLRCVAVRNGSEVQLWSRNHLSFNHRFPGIIDALSSLPADNFTLDGEIVAYDNEGRTSFSLLQQRSAEAHPVFAAFDLIQLLGRETMQVPLLDRKGLVAQVVEASDVLQLVEHKSGDPEEFLAEACAAEWEGIIAKRADGIYRSGRSLDWRKLKCLASQELVIGGWTEPKGSRSGFGALLVGYFEEVGGPFRFAGKVGTGFDNALLSTLHKRLLELESSASPFFDPVKEMTAHWVDPVLVADIGFTEWTSDGKLRHPRFEGLRNDKKAVDVTRERR